MEINGKTLVFTDCHLGLRNGSVGRLNTAIVVFRQMLKTIRDEGVSNVLFVGDAFHDRKSIDVNVLNAGSRLFSAMASLCDVYMVVGNHDCFYKTTTNVSSVNIFGENPRMHIVGATEEVLMNGQRCLLVPWLGDVSVYPKGTFDLMFGHFDIGVDYLVAAYVEEHGRENITNEGLAAVLSKDSLIAEKVGDGGIDAGVVSSGKPSASLIGDFVDVVKEGGTVYSGHIHNHREFYTRGRKFVFIGSPYQQTFGEIGSVDGYYVLDEHNEATFHPSEGVPVHVKVRMSDVMKAGIDKYDFSFVEGNIVKRVYDVDVPRQDVVAIGQRIADARPAEEISADFEIAQAASEEVDNETLEVIRKSKLDYIMRYIDRMDNEALSAKGIDKGRLFDLLKDYYDKVEGTVS